MIRLLFKLLPIPSLILTSKMLVVDLVRLSIHCNEHALTVCFSVAQVDGSRAHPDSTTGE